MWKIFALTVIAVAFLFTSLQKEPVLREVGGAVVITGCSSGIGKTTALHLARVGYTVFAGARKPEDLNELKKLSGSKDFKGKLIPVSFDVNSQADIDRVYEEVSKIVGNNGLVGLINNAGIGAKFLPFEVSDLSLYETYMNTNFYSVVKITHKFLPLLKRNNGTIIQISSPSAFLPIHFYSHYSTSKSALDMFSRSISRELKLAGVHSVTVNAASVKSRMVDDAVKESQLVEKESKSWPVYYHETASKMAKWAAGTFSNTVPADVVSELIEGVLRNVAPSTNYYAGPHPPFFLYLVPDDLVQWVFSWGLDYA